MSHGHSCFDSKSILAIQKATGLAIWKKQVWCRSDPKWLSLWHDSGRSKGWMLSFTKKLHHLLHQCHHVWNAVCYPVPCADSKKPTWTLKWSSRKRHVGQQKKQPQELQDREVPAGIKRPQDFKTDIGYMMLYDVIWCYVFIARVWKKTGDEITLTTRSCRHLPPKSAEITQLRTMRFSSTPLPALQQVNWEFTDLNWRIAILTDFSLFLNQTSLSSEYSSIIHWSVRSYWYVGGIPHLCCLLTLS